MKQTRQKNRKQEQTQTVIGQKTHTLHVDNKHQRGKTYMQDRSEGGKQRTLERNTRETDNQIHVIQTEGKING